MTKKTPEWKLDAFDWLALNRWTPDKILNSCVVKGKRYCKICDTFIAPKRENSHVKWHVKERQFILTKRKEAALEAAREAKKLAAEERKRLKELEIVE